jgi:bacillithiol biosynthesis deacetylase BshB1
MILLAFGAHPDDVEIAAGGTLANAVAHGHRVVIADLTRGERATAGTPEERAREAAAAARVLGVERLCLDLPDSGLDRGDPAQNRAVVEVLRQTRPDLVFAPVGRDLHPDHREGHHLVRRGAYLAGLARYPAAGAPHRPALILFYPASREAPPRASVVVDISATLERKMEALACYGSQFVRAAGGPATPLNAEGFLERVRSRAAVAGMEIGVSYGEPFVADRPLRAVDPLAVLGSPTPESREKAR